MSICRIIGPALLTSPVLHLRKVTFWADVALVTCAGFHLWILVPDWPWDFVHWLRVSYSSRLDQHCLDCWPARAAAKASYPCRCQDQYQRRLVINARSGCHEGVCCGSELAVTLHSVGGVLAIAMRSGHLYYFDFETLCCFHGVTAFCWYSWLYASLQSQCLWAERPDTSSKTCRYVEEYSGVHFGAEST